MTLSKPEYQQFNRQVIDVKQCLAQWFSTVVPTSVTSALSGNFVKCRFSGFSQDPLNQKLWGGTQQSVLTIYSDDATHYFKHYWYGGFMWMKKRKDFNLQKYILEAKLTVWHQSLIPASKVANIKPNVQSWINDTKTSSYFSRGRAHASYCESGRRSAASSKGYIWIESEKRGGRGN